jgi:hypothetical protein
MSLKMRKAQTGERPMSTSAGELAVTILCAAHALVCRDPVVVSCFVRNEFLTAQEVREKKQSGYP